MELTSDVAFSPVVKKHQERFGSRKSYEKMESRGGFRNKITEDLFDFIAERDSFYLGTAAKNGQPYIQHRGGPSGFLKIINPNVLAFADYSGNKQYITAGTLDENDKAFIFLMDYANRKRVKIWGTAKVIEDDMDLFHKLIEKDYPAKVERAIIFEVKMVDINCPQHIKPRFTQEQIDFRIAQLQQEINQLKKENQLLRKER